MADISKIPDFSANERGKRGKRGHRGHDGATGPSDGPTGPTGSTGAGVAGPTGPTGGSANGLLETLSADVTTDVTVSTINAVLLSIPVVVGAGETLLVFFSAAAQNSGANRTQFALEVDGLASVPPKGAMIIHPAGSPNVVCAAIDAKLAGLTAGAHTVDIRWVASAGTSSILGTTGNLVQHGTLIVERVNV